jgi:hypothetical protein
MVHRTPVIGDYGEHPMRYLPLDPYIIHQHQPYHLVMMEQAVNSLCIL